MWGTGPCRLPSVTYQRKVAMGTTYSSAITVRNKASKSDPSWKANSERNGHETGSAALREGTVRRGKERPHFFNNKMCTHVDF